MEHSTPSLKKAISPSVTTRVASWSLGLLAGGIVILLAMEWLLFPLTVDDAYISYHYSNNLAQGHGLVWHPGGDPVEGYTNFLWVVILAVFIKVGFDVVLIAKILGILFSLGSVVMMYQLVRRMNPTGIGVMPALLLAASPAFALWAVSGLETVLFIFILLVALHQYLIEDEIDMNKPQRYWSVVWFMLLGMTRPEGALVFIVLTGLRLFLWVKQGISRKQVFTYLGWVFLIGSLCLVYFVGRWMYFGYPLPNTFYVKAQSGLSNIARQVGVYLLPYALRLFPFIILAVYAVGTGEKLQKGDLYIGAALMCFALLNLASSDWMPGHRLALPMTPLIFLLARQPLEWILNKAFQEQSIQRRLTHAAIALGLFAFALTPFLYTAPLFNRVMATQMDMSIYRWSEEMQTIVDGQYIEVGNWLADHAPSDCSVIAGNVGAIAYLSGCNVIDQIGLTNEHIARNGWTVNYLLGLAPEFIVIESDTSEEFGGLYGTGGERWLKSETFFENYELLFVIDNGKTDEAALFIHHLPHATWLYARKDLGLQATKE